MRICDECHHFPSGRVAEYGACCSCKCHDVADAAPDLLAACEAAKKYLEPDLVEPGRTVFWNLVASIAKAKGEKT